MASDGGIKERQELCINEWTPTEGIFFTQTHNNHDEGYGEGNPPIEKDYDRAHDDMRPM